MADLMNKSIKESSFKAHRGRREEICSMRSVVNLRALCLCCRVGCLWTASQTWTTVSPASWRPCSSRCLQTRPGRRRSSGTRSSASTPSTDRCPGWWTAAASTWRNTVPTHQHFFNSLIHLSKLELSEDIFFLYLIVVQVCKQWAFSVWGAQRKECGRYERFLFLTLALKVV